MYSDISFTCKNGVQYTQNNVEVEYAFCLSDFFKERFASDNKKYHIMKEIIEEDDIVIMYGKDNDYFETLDKWIGMPCEIQYT